MVVVLYNGQEATITEATRLARGSLVPISPQNIKERCSIEFIADVSCSEGTALEITGHLHIKWAFFCGGKSAFGGINLMRGEAKI